jgi:hypothetical protein
VHLKLGSISTESNKNLLRATFCPPERAFSFRQ